MINECGAVGGMRTGRGAEVLGGNQPQCHISHHKFHVTKSDIELGLLRWGSQYRNLCRKLQVHYNSNLNQRKCFARALSLSLSYRAYTVIHLEIWPTQHCLDRLSP
jgi:hypothetical protein